MFLSGLVVSLRGWPTQGCGFFGRQVWLHQPQDLLLGDHSRAYSCASYPHTRVASVCVLEVGGGTQQFGTNLLSSRIPRSGLGEDLKEQNLALGLYGVSHRDAQQKAGCSHT